MDALYITLSHILQAEQRFVKFLKTDAHVRCNGKWNSRLITD